MKRRRLLAVTGGVVGAMSVPWTGVGTAKRTTSAGYGSSEFAYGFTGFAVDSDATVDIGSDAPASVDFQIRGGRVTDDDSVEFDLTVTNESAETIQVTTGRPEPFGLFGFSETDGDGEFLAWSDGYGMTEGERVENCNKRLPYPDDLRIIEVSPDESLDESYTLSNLTHTIQRGSFDGTLDFGIHRQDGDESWHPEIGVSVELEPLRDPDEPEFARGFSVSPINAEGFDGRMDVQVVKQPTDAYPAVIDVTFESGWEDRRSVEAERGFPFGVYALDGDTGQRLVLLPAQLYAPGFVESPGCWQPTVVPCRNGNPYSSVNKAFDPRETTSERFVVLGHPADACPEAGTYSATATYRSEGEGLTEEDQEGDLGISIDLATRSGAYRESLERRENEPGTSTATPDAHGTDGTPTQFPTPTPTLTRSTATGSTTDTSDGTGGTQATPADGTGFGVVVGLLSLGGVLTHWLQKARGD